MPSLTLVFSLIAWLVACVFVDCQQLPRIPQGGQQTGGGAALQVDTCVQGSRGIIVQLEYGDYSPTDPTLVNLRVEASIQDQYGNVVGHSSSGTDVTNNALRLCIDYEDLMGEDVLEFGATVYLNDADHTDDSVQRYVLSVSTASDPPEQQQRVWIQSRPDDSLNYVGSQAPYPLVAYVRVNFNDESSGFITSGSGPGDAIYSTLHDMLKIHLCTNNCLIA